jgi:hypothetical protein
VLARLGVLPASLRGGVWGAPRALGLGLHHGSFDGLEDRIVVGTRLEKQLEEDRTLELLEGVGDLVAGAARGVPLGDDAARVGHADTQIRRADLSFPDNVAVLHETYVT